MPSAIPRKLPREWQPGTEAHTPTVVRRGISLRLSIRSTQGSHTGPRGYLPICLYNCGWTAFRQGSLDRAIAILDESKEVERELCDDSAMLNSTRPGKPTHACVWIGRLRPHTAGSTSPRKGVLLRAPV
jgi:hypothetical protein